MPSNPELTILGGGPAGLAVAYYAQAAGLDFRLFEKAQQVGGHCRTLEFAGHRYDTGAHRFHDRDPEVTADVRALLGEELQTVEAPSQICHRGRRIDFPPSPAGWLRAAGPADAARTAVEVLRGRLLPRRERSFEDHVLNRYGRTLGGPLLLDYSEKLWGLPAHQLAPDVATRRLSGLTLAALAIELLWPARKSRHLDGSFLYPRSGYGAIVEALAGALPSAKLLLGSPVAGLELEGDRVVAIQVEGGGRFAVPGRLVSTLPVTLLVRLLGEALPDAARQAASGLRFRQVRLIFLRLAVESVSRNATLYLPDRRYAVSRVAEPRNRSADLAPAGETALVAEVACSAGDELAALDDDALARRVVAELEEAGLIEARWVLAWRHNRLDHAYPVYALDYRERLAAVGTALARFTNLDWLGRGGRFWYSHLHDQLRAARDYLRSFASDCASGATRRPSPSMPAHIRRSARKLQ